MKARILVIEDSEANLELMLYLLRAWGFEPAAARDGREGLVAALAQPPDLVICDLALPMLSGYEVARQIRRAPLLARTRLVAVTAYAAKEDRDQAKAAGFHGYTAKPIDPETFVDEVQRHLPPELRRALAPAGEAMQEAVAAAPARRTLLVVDDREANRAFAKFLLGGVGYRVVLAAGMMEALRLARTGAPDLIVSDVVMRDGSGFDFIAAVKADAALAAIPFVFLTSTATNGVDRARGLKLGARRFLFRPIEPQALLEEIAACLDEPGEA